MAPCVHADTFTASRLDPCLAAGCMEMNVKESQILSGCGGAGGDEKIVLTPHLQTYISWRRLSRVPARIRTVTLGSNFTVRIFCQVRFCRCKISGLELVFSVVDLNIRAAYQLISVEPLHRN